MNDTFDYFDAILDGKVENKWREMIKPYLAAGKRVVPLGENKQPCQKGFTSDNYVLDDKCWDYPFIRGFGVVQGKYSNEYTFDFDYDADNTWNKARELILSKLPHIDIDKCYYTISGRIGGGRHLTFNCEEDLQTWLETDEANDLDLLVLAKTKKDADNKDHCLIELKADGRQVVKPGSLHSSGNTYKAVNGNGWEPTKITLIDLINIIQLLATLDEREENDKPKKKIKEVSHKNIIVKDNTQWEYTYQDVISKYNKEISITGALSKYGYTDVTGNWWKHPSDSCNSVNIIDTGHSFHFGSNDPIKPYCANAKNGWSFCDPFELYCAFECSGDKSKAIKILSELYQMNKPKDTIGDPMEAFEDDKIIVKQISEEMEDSFKEPTSSIILRSRSVDPEWMVENLFHKGETTVICGPPGTFKTTFVADIAFSLIFGNNKVFDTYETPKKKCPKTKDEVINNKPFNVVWLCPEGSNEIIRLKIPAWCKTRNKPTTYSEYLKIKEISQPITEHSVEAIIKKWDYLENGLFIIDTLSKHQDIDDENSNSQMSQWLNRVSKIIKYYNATCIIVHHTTKDKKGYRGASSLEGDVDNVYQLSVEDDLVNIKSIKMRNGPKTDFQLKPEIIKLYDYIDKGLNKKMTAKTPILKIVKFNIPGDVDAPIPGNKENDIIKSVAFKILKQLPKRGEEGCSKEDAIEDYKNDGGKANKTLIRKAWEYLNEKALIHGQRPTGKNHGNVYTTWDTDFVSTNDKTNEDFEDGLD
jgi:hypothetical protein